MVSIMLYSGSSLATAGCVKNVLGDLVCSPPQGTIAKNALDDLVYGKGQCIKMF